MTSSGLCTGTNTLCAASVQGRAQVGKSRETPRRQGSAALPAKIWGEEKVGDEKRCLFVLELYLTYILTLLLKWESWDVAESRHIS